MEGKGHLGYYQHPRRRAPPNSIPALTVQQAFSIDSLQHRHKN